MIAKINGDRALKLARDVLDIEADAVRGLRDRIDDNFVSAVDLILGCRGRVVVSGIGKSGHIGRKLAATLASTGTPAFFVHPAEASHGDLGMVTADDVFIALSNSGESEELVAILPLVKRIGAKLIAMTGRPQSTLGQLADVHLNAGVEKEACPMNLAPTASTTAALAMGDALAMAVLDARGFGADDFARSHPGGALGRRLLTYVRDVMRTGDQVPVVQEDVTVRDALFQLTAKRMGMTAIVNAEGGVAGIFTDGDLRRVLERVGDFRELPIASVMTKGPRTIGPDQLAVEAVELMERHRINQMLVVDGAGKLIGALNMHDLFEEGNLNMAVPQLDANARAARVRLMIFDVDGVLTDGGLMFTGSGDTMKVFNSLDGHGAKLLREAGIDTAIITGRRSDIVAVRAKELRITHLYQGVEDKRVAFAQLLAETGTTAEECGYMGDDWPDLAVMLQCGFAAAPANAHPDVLARAHYVAAARGGNGAVREVTDLILRAQGRYDALLAAACAPHAEPR